jgi:HAD superfamily hydrolase (TIGR01509 family)
VAYFLLGPEQEVRMSLPAFRAVIFDMDGLLLDSERIAREAWMRAAEAQGVPIPAEVYLQVIGRTFQDTEQTFLRLLGAEFPFQGVCQLRLQYGEDYITRHGMPRKVGAIELLDLLQTRGVPRAVATSTARQEAWRRLHLAELAPYFAILCGGDEVMHGKPAPDLFLLAAERLGVAPDACIVLEDSELGVRAARQAGMTPILVPDLKSPSAEVAALAHAVCTSLHDVTALMMAAFGA